jgi:acetyl esterase/lipase
MLRLMMLSILLVMTASNATGQQQQQNTSRNYPPMLDDATVEVYKEIGDVKLNIYIFTPENHKSSDKRPAIVFFFGGGWNSGSPAQFQYHCRYLASRGMVAMTADYRVFSRHKTRANKCVADGKSAVRWIRTHAARLGIDPDRVASGGGSAGGHVAACTGTIKGMDEPGEDMSISSKPNAMVLFNPATVLAPVEGMKMKPNDKKRMATLEVRLGVEPTKLSPYHNVTSEAPPTIIFHGTGDTTVPFVTARLFTDKMDSEGNLCQLVSFKDRPHGFFNYKGSSKDYIATVRAMDEFLAEQGFLKGKPTIK